MADERLLPSDIPTERLVLGAILADENAIHDARGVLVPDDFTGPNRRVWESICGLYDTGAAVDYVTVGLALSDAGYLESVGGLSYITGLTDGLPHIVNLEAYIQRVKDKATLRRIAIAGDSLLRRACGGLETPQEILDSAGDVLMSLAPQQCGDGLVSAKELVDKVGLTKLFAPRKHTGVPLPWRWLDDATCGLQAGQLCYLGGWTSTGKSSAALQVAAHAARHGKYVAIFSLEMTNPSMFTRMVYQQGRIDSERAKHGVLNAHDRQQIQATAAEITALPIHFCDRLGATTAAIHAEIRRFRLQNPLDLVIIDYIQRVSVVGRHQNRAQEVSATSRTFKEMAMGFGIPFLVLSQLLDPPSESSGKPEKHRRPTMRDLKESRDMANDADIVWLIDRPPGANPDQAAVTFILEKQREGPRDIWEEFYFFPRFQRFDPQEKEHPNA